MANLLFKRGLQENLDAIVQNNTVQDGTFYFTTDTNRLYIGNGSNLNLLNQSIHLVQNSDTLTGITANLNDFYYLKDENILAFYLGKDSEGKDLWAQINSDTNTDTYLSSVKDAQVISTDSGLQVSFALCQSQENLLTGDVTSLDDITVSFTIPTEGLVEITGAKVGLTAVESTTDNENKVNISTVGAGADGSTNISLKAQNNIDISVEEDTNNILISATDTQYDLVVDNNQLKFNNLLNEDTTTIKFTGDDSINITGNSNNEIVINHENYTLTEKEAVEEEVNIGETIDIINNITLQQGHIADYQISKVKISDDELIAKGTMTAADNGGLKLTLTKNNEDNLQDIVANNILYFTIGENNQRIYNQSKLDVYTTDEIDSKLQGLNSMTYKGTIGQENSTIQSLLELDSVQSGDTYKVAYDGEYAIDIIENESGDDSFKTVEAKVGDLFIAKGEENENGLLTTVEWTHIPSGEATDTTYTLTVVEEEDDNQTSHKVILLHGTDDNDYRIEIKDDSIVQADIIDNALKFSHVKNTISATSSPSSKLESEDSFNITELSYDEYGHIVGTNTVTYELPSSDTSLSIEFKMSDGIVSEANLKATNQGSDNYSSIILAPDTKGYINFDKVIEKDSELNSYDAGVSINHKIYENIETNTNTLSTLSSNGTFNAITAITRDNGGHVTGYTVQPYKLPKDNNTTYTFSDSISDEGILTYTITNNDNEDQFIRTFASDTLNITKNNTNIAVNLVWGAF